MKIPERHIAFRLAHELEGLLLGIKADGRIVEAENERAGGRIDLGGRV